MKYQELTSPEALELQQSGAVLLMPMGAVEQHGLGMPLGTDTIRAEHVVEQVVARFKPGRVLQLPSWSYGVSPHHTNLPGTLTLPPVLVVQAIVALCESAADAGWRKLLVVTGHGGNNPALQLVAQELLTRRPEFVFAWSPVSTLAKQAHAAMTRAQVTGHCGESETSQMLAIRPDLVRTDRLVPGVTSLAELDPQPRLSRQSGPFMAVTFDRYHATGVLGDPTQATEQDGHTILDEVTEVVATYVQQLLHL